MKHAVTELELLLCNIVIHFKQKLCARKLHEYCKSGELRLVPIIIDYLAPYNYETNKSGCSTNFVKRLSIVK